MPLDYHGHMEPRAGAEVTPSIRLVERLGSGGMGQVWRAQHEGLHKAVAVKLLSAEPQARGPEALERFAREARLAASIDCPHAVAVHDFGHTGDGTPFIVMELAEGEELRAHMRGGRLPLTQVAALVEQVATGLTATHELGIVHRDIKPENIIVVGDDPWLLKVVDFGIAKRVDAVSAPDTVTKTGAMLGTPRYLSPELIESAKEATVHADLWALAVVAYEALVGEPPFVGETLGSLCIAIAKAHHTPPSAVAENVPAEVDAWFARAFAAEPGDRFVSAAAMAAAMNTAANATVATRPPPTIMGDTRDVPAQPRRRSWQLVGALAMVTVAAGAAWSSVSPQPNPGARAASPLRTSRPNVAIAEASAARLATESPHAPTVESPPAASPMPKFARPTRNARTSPSATTTPLAAPVPTAAPSVDANECLAYDATTKKWIYTCHDAP